MNKSELTDMMKKSLAALFSPLNSGGGSGAGTNSPAGASGTENRSVRPVLRHLFIPQAERS